LISRDVLLGSLDVGYGITLWHLGVLVSVLLGGWLYDRRLTISSAT
jgi:hypothetical protein